MTLEIPTKIKEFLFYIANEPLIWGSLLAVLIFLYLYRQQSLKNKPIEVASADTGSIQVSPKALLELIHYACASTPGISRIRIKHKIKNKKLNLKVLLRISSKEKIVPISTSLQDHLLDILKENLGIDALGHIDILITGFHKKIKTSTHIESENKPEEINSFLGNYDKDTTEK